MKARTITTAAIIVASTLVVGCAKVKSLVGGKPKGQVVATVGGDEITNAELSAELGNFSSKDPAVMKAAQQQALQRIIMRDLLARKAKDQKMDKSQAYVMQMRVGEQGALAQMYQRKLAEAVAAPGRQEAEAYIFSHAGQFADRKVLVVDQIITQLAKLKKEQITPLKTLEDVKSLLVAQNVPFQQNVATIDSLNADPNMMSQISKLPEGDVFVVPQGGAMIFNRISSSRSVPLSGEMAVLYATNVLRSQKAQELVGAQMKSIRDSAESTIVYNPAFKPPPATAAKPGAAPAAGAAAPPPATPPAPAKK